MLDSAENKKASGNHQGFLEAFVSMSLEIQADFEKEQGERTSFAKSLSLLSLFAVFAVFFPERISAKSSSSISVVSPKGKDSK